MEAWFFYEGVSRSSRSERPATILKKRLWHRFFPVNFAKLLRTPFLTEQLRWLLLRIFKTFITKFNSSSFWGISGSITAIIHQSQLCTEIPSFWNPCCNFLWPTCTSILSGSTYFETLAKRTTLDYFPFIQLSKSLE